MVDLAIPPDSKTVADPLGVWFTPALQNRLLHIGYSDWVLTLPYVPL